MKFRTLGRSGAVVSTYALGTMTFGSETPEPEAARQLTEYTARGGNLIETADVYSGGESERIVGRWLGTLDEQARANIFLATKGRFPVGVAPRDSGNSRRHLRRALEGSLSRLGVDHVDLYQLHAWDPLTPLEESIGFLEDAVRSGKISYGGLSNFTGWQIAKATALAAGRVPLISLQPQYNLLVREVEWEIVPASIDGGLGILPWSPLGGGWLTGKYTATEAPTGATRLGEDPDRGVEAYDRRSARERTWTTLAALREIAAARDVPLSQVALAWLHDRPGVTSIILGARTVIQLTENLGASDVELTTDEVVRLDQASDPAAADYPYGEPGREQRSRTVD
ncbi:MAG: aldo/keto reductase [Salinibacterium sp.]|nr:aldo/keto reductase [Salinibacterium sp.]